MDQQGEKKMRQKESKVESNDNPEIPDRGETSDMPGIPSGVKIQTWIQ